MKTSLIGGSASTLATGQAPQALAIDASFAYWTNFDAAGPERQGR
jgi:hypothetical protein